MRYTAIHVSIGCQSHKKLVLVFSDISEILSIIVIQQEFQKKHAQKQGKNCVKIKLFQEKTNICIYQIYYEYWGRLLIFRNIITGYVYFFKRPSFKKGSGSSDFSSMVESGNYNLEPQFCYKDVHDIIYLFKFFCFKNTHYFKLFHKTQKNI